MPLFELSGTAVKYTNYVPSFTALSVPLPSTTVCVCVFVELCHCVFLLAIPGEGGGGDGGGKGRWWRRGEMFKRMFRANVFTAGCSSSHLVRQKHTAPMEKSRLTKLSTTQLTD